MGTLAILVGSTPKTSDSFIFKALQDCPIIGTDIYDQIPGLEVEPVHQFVRDSHQIILQAFCDATPVGILLIKKNLRCHNIIDLAQAAILTIDQP